MILRMTYYLLGLLYLAKKKLYNFQIVGLLLSDTFFFFNLTYCRWTSSLPSCLWSLRYLHLSPVHALRFFIAMQVQHSYNSSTNG